MYMNIIYSHTLREVDRNKKYCIVLYCIATLELTASRLEAVNASVLYVTTM